MSFRPSSDSWDHLDGLIFWLWQVAQGVAISHSPPPLWEEGYIPFANPMGGCAGVCMYIYGKHISAPPEEWWIADIEQLFALREFMI